MQRTVKTSILQFVQTVGPDCWKGGGDFSAPLFSYVCGKREVPALARTCVASQVNRQQSKTITRTSSLVVLQM